MSPKTDGPTRREFVQAGGGAVAGLAAAGRVPEQAREALAMDGGPRTVTFPSDRQAGLTNWPRYGDADKRALHDLIDRCHSSTDFYDELPAFEKEWKEYTGSPFVKFHINGASALTSMYFALDLPPGSEILVPSYDFFSDCLAMRFFGYVPVFIDSFANEKGLILLEDTAHAHGASMQGRKMDTWGPPGCTT